MNIATTINSILHWMQIDDDRDLADLAFHPMQKATQSHECSENRSDLVGREKQSIGGLKTNSSWIKRPFEHELPSNCKPGFGHCSACLPLNTS